MKDTLYENVCNRLVNIFMKRFGIDIESWNDNSTKKHFLSKDLNFNVRDLIYIFFDVENEFDITIPEEAVTEGCFCTFNSVAELVEKQLSKKHEIA